VGMEEDGLKMHYAGEKDYTRKLYDMVDWTIDNRDKAYTEERLGPNTKEMVGDTVGYLIPVEGTFKYSDETYKAIKRGDFTRGVVAGGFTILSVASDMLFLTGIGAGVKGITTALKAAPNLSKGKKALTVAKELWHGVRAAGPAIRAVQGHAYSSYIVAAYFKPELSEEETF